MYVGQGEKKRKPSLTRGGDILDETFDLFHATVSRFTLRFFFF
jgi:hypothetical protein